MVLPNGQFRLMFSPKNYEASVAFYRDKLQLSIDHDWDYGGGDCGTVFHAGGGMIELLGLLPGSQYVQPQGLSVLIQVDDIDQWHTQALQREVKITQEPTTYPWGHRVLRVTDPDGIVVSLFSLVTA
jgi:predicted enzyme related to lactoylglutathione lyase